LIRALVERVPTVRDAAARRDYRAALTQLSQLGPSVDRFFVDVLVMADDLDVRRARLSLMSHLRDAVRTIADVSEVVAEK
jgi:glycyl-tRNA synthetase beta chain